MTYPEVPSDPTGVVGRRVVAALVDVTIFFGIIILIWQSQAVYEPVPDSFAFGDACEVIADKTDATQCFEIGARAYYLEDSAVGNALSVASLVGSFLIFGLLQGLTGCTPGKLLLGIRTVAEDGQVPGAGKGILRGLLWMVDAPCGLFIPIGIVGFICALTTQGHRRVGDMVAKTFVVTKAAAGQPIVVPGLTTAPPVPVGSGWNTEAPPGGWGTPVPGAQTAPPDAAPRPQWDEARGTYIQWDPIQVTWVQWDEPSKQWIPIAGR